MQVSRSLIAEKPHVETDNEQCEHGLLEPRVAATERFVEMSVSVSLLIDQDLGWMLFAICSAQCFGYENAYPLLADCGMHCVGQTSGVGA